MQPSATCPSVQTRYLGVEKPDKWKQVDWATDLSQQAVRELLLLLLLPVELAHAFQVLYNDIKGKLIDIIRPFCRLHG